MNFLYPQEGEGERESCLSDFLSSLSIYGLTTYSRYDADRYDAHTARSLADLIFLLAGFPPP